MPITEDEYPGYQFVRVDGWVPVVGPRKSTIHPQPNQTFWGWHVFTGQISLGYFDGETGEFMNILHKGVAEPSEVRITHYKPLNSPDTEALDMKHFELNGDWVHPESLEELSRYVPKGTKDG